MSSSKANRELVTSGERTVYDVHKTFAPSRGGDSAILSTNQFHFSSMHDLRRLEVKNKGYRAILCSSCNTCHLYLGLNFSIWFPGGAVGLYYDL